MEIDLNCDMGESFGAYTIGRDAEVMPSITSANVACGFHAGDPSVMRETVRLAIALTLIETAGLVVVIAVGLPDVGTRDLLAMPQGWGGVVAGAAIVFFAAGIWTIAAAFMGTR